MKTQALVGICRRHSTAHLAGATREGSWGLMKRVSKRLTPSQTRSWPDFEIRTLQTAQQGRWSLDMCRAGRPQTLSVAAKAADAGYNLVIVLAGIHNALRRQTQDRAVRTLVHKRDLWWLGTAVGDFRFGRKSSQHTPQRRRQAGAARRKEEQGGPQAACRLARRVKRRSSAQTSRSW